MKFCPNCGTQLADDAVFCSGCGTNLGPQVNTQQPPYSDDQYGYQAPNYGYDQAPQPAPKAKKKFDLKNISKKKLIILGGALLAVILAVILTFTFLIGPRALARRCANAYMNGNAKQYVNCLPSFYWDDDEEKQEAIEDYEDTFEDIKDDVKNSKIEKIVIQKLTKDEREDFEDRIEYYEKYYDNYKSGKLNVNSIKKVSVLVSYKDGDGELQTYLFHLYVAKYNGKWVVIS